MKNTRALLCFFIILFIKIIDKSPAKSSPVPDSSFVFPGPSTSDNFNPRSFTNSYDSYLYIAPGHPYEDKFEGRHFDGYKTSYRKPFSSMGHGCRGLYKCDFEGYGSRPNNEEYYSQNLPSKGNLATTSIKINGSPNNPVSTDNNGIVIGQANAQTVTFNFGPFSASFSTSNSLIVPHAPIM